MYCYYCSKEIPDSVMFCPFCGKRSISRESVDSGDTTQRMGSVNPMNYPDNMSVGGSANSYQPVYHAKKSNSALIIACVAVFAIIVIAAVSVYFIHQKYSSEGQTQMTTRTMGIQPSAPAPAPTPAEPAQQAFPRVSTYGSGYTYKNMTDIHTSVSATDDEAFMVQDIIHQFNNAWIDYMNNYNTTVFNYLREGTAAYGYAVKYGAKDISEEYLLIDVQDVRRTDRYYYAWVHEIINEYSDKTERKEYHWVYKIGYDDGGYYIVDYTTDPAYK